ncbi:MAG: methyl-accepting chemotaxis protein [Cytophagales bacterium]|nr:methyl-accepting chemotaxis protein [Cytophagales bacterium]
MNPNDSFWRLTVARKIALTCGIVMLISAFSGVSSLLTFRASRKVDETITNHYYPLISQLKEFSALINQTDDLTVNWMYLPNPDDKSALIEIIKEIYPASKNDVFEQLKNWPDSNLYEISDHFNSYDEVLPFVYRITGTLVKEEHYNDDLLLFELIPVLDNEILLPLKRINEELQKEITVLEQDADHQLAAKFSSFDRLERVIIIMTILAFLLGGGCTFLITRSMVDRIQQLNLTVQQLSKGVIPEDILHQSSDEIGEITESVQKLKSGLISTSLFAQEIGKGNLSAEHVLLSDGDVLGKSLLAMQSNLNKTIHETNDIVSVVAEEGKLGSRIALDNKSGAWAELSLSINNLFESITLPFKTLESILTAMADGDLTGTYEIEAKGEVLKLSSSLNDALGSLNQLLQEIDRSIQTVEDNSTEMLISGEEMSTNTSEIATAIAQMSTGAQNQVIKVDESSRLVESILSSSDEMAQRSESIYSAAKTGVINSTKGSKMIENIAASINNIRSVSDATNEALNTLSRRSNEIEKVLQVITEIASQTNLLALNAAIEAAQAGEAGRGFSVVAEEIRKLAEGSRASAKEIEQLITEVNQDTSTTMRLMNEMIGGVDKGVRDAKQAFDVFEEISTSSSNTLGYSEDILKLSKDQSLKIGEVVSITESIVVIAEQTAAGTEEVATSSSELEAGMNSYIEKSKRLNKISAQLKSNIGQFKLQHSIGTRPQATQLIA